MKRAIILGGGGDTGRRLAMRLAASDVEIVVTSRNPEEISWAEPGLATVEGWRPADEDFSGFCERLGGEFDVVVNLIGAWLVGARSALVETTRRVVEALPAGCRYVHCSAVSVWGSRPGEVVDERAPVFAEQRVARLHLEAEEAVTAAREAGFEGVVLRLPHIYGPGRERTVTLMRNGRFVILGNGANRMHHLHVDDLVEVLAATILLDVVPSPLYAVVDDDDGTYGDYCDFVTAATGAVPLPFMSLSSALDGGLAGILGPHFSQREVVEEFWRFMTSDLRIDNAKMKRELGVQLTFPTFREGLPEVLDADLRPPTPTTGAPMSENRKKSEIEARWRSWTARLSERPDLAFTDGAEPELLERELSDAVIRVSPFRSPTASWARVAFFGSSRMDNINMVVWPRPDRAAPVLGIEVVFNTDGLAFAAFDLWGEASAGWSKLLETAAEREGIAGKTVAVEGRLANLLTPDAVVVRDPEVDEDLLFEAAWALAESYLELLADAPLRPTEEGRRELSEVSHRLRDRPGGVDHLAALFGREWTEEFLTRIYYPAPS